MQHQTQCMNPGRLKIAGTSLNISAEDIDYSNKADENIDCDYKGDDIQIGFNSKFSPFKKPLKSNNNIILLHMIKLDL